MNTNQPLQRIPEVWKPYTVWDDVLRKEVDTGYQVSTLGRIRSHHPGHVGKILKGGEGPVNREPKTRYVWLSSPLKMGSERVKVDTLVATVFLGPMPEGHRIVHKNSLVWDDRLENLAYEDASVPMNIYTPMPTDADLDLEKARMAVTESRKALDEAVERYGQTMRALSAAEARAAAQDGV